MTTQHTDLTNMLFNKIEPSLSYTDQMRSFRLTLAKAFGSNSGLLWTYLDQSRPLKGTPYELGIGFETSDYINHWLESHANPWQATLELLRNPMQAWSQDRRTAHKSLTKLLAKGFPEDIYESTAMVEAMYELLEEPVWRPSNLNILHRIIEETPHVFWKLPGFRNLDFVKYKSSPLGILFGANLSFGSRDSVKKEDLDMLSSYWKEFNFGAHGAAHSCPSHLGYIVLAEVLGWTDQNWHAITGYKRTAEATWSLVDKLAPSHLLTWKDLLDDDQNPHLSLHYYLSKALKRIPPNPELNNISDILKDLEFNLPYDSF